MRLPCEVIGPIKGLVIYYATEGTFYASNQNNTGVKCGFWSQTTLIYEAVRPWTNENFSML